MVEDDLMIAHSLTAALLDAAYTVDAVENAGSAHSALCSQPYDLLLLDLNLPDDDGMNILRHLRRCGNALPVIIMTARDGLDERITGFDIGADDFLIKPFALSELLARIRAVLRRAAGQAEGIIGNGNLRANPANRTALLAGRDQPINLTKKEFTLLQALLLNQGRIQSRENLEDKLYRFGEEVESNAVDYLICNLRKKLGSEQIKNIRGAGWMIPR